jgi:hypothetical protein
MSTTVHYFGKVKDQDSIREIQDEFREIAQVSGWPHEIVDQNFVQEGEASPTRLTLKGIRIVLGKNAAPLQLTFDKDCYLSHIYHEMPVRENAPRGLTRGSPPAARPILHQVHTSTSLRPGDAQAHITLVKLLDYLKKRYVPNLEVIDNTGYWYSRDESVLAPKKLELAKK